MLIMADLRKTDIYCITCKVNGKMYIGQTMHGVQKRWRHHLGDVKGGSKAPFHAAIREHGKDTFFSETILTCNKMHADDNETKLINMYDTRTPIGYNSAPGGSHCPAREPSRHPSHIYRKNLLPLYITERKGKDWWMVCVPETKQKYFQEKDAAIQHRNALVHEKFLNGVVKIGICGQRRYQTHTDLPVYVRYKGSSSTFRVDVPGAPRRHFRTIEDAVGYRDRVVK